MSETNTLQVGHWVALTLAEGAAPLSAYVGQIEAVDDRGVRLTLIDWLTGDAHGYDLFVPWSEIRAALVATPDHDVSRFGDAGAKWQTSMQNRFKPGAEDGES
jgi:hypothetical protein